MHRIRPVSLGVFLLGCGLLLGLKLPPSRGITIAFFMIVAALVWIAIEMLISQRPKETTPIHGHDHQRRSSHA